MKLRYIIIVCMGLASLHGFTATRKIPDQVSPDFDFRDRLQEEMSAKYNHKYYQVTCSFKDRTMHHDWSENDLSVYKDGRIEYSSVKENRIVTLQLGIGVLCKSVPPEEIWSMQNG